MISWDTGAHADNFNFRHHYYTSPVYISYLLTSRGLVSPSIDQNFTACELVSAQCLSIDLHALTVQGRWYGAALDSQQLKMAQDMAAQTELQPQELVLCDEPLDDFLKRSDLPEFSYIFLQGVWSFIPPTTQQALVEFFRRKLKIGGVLYISYQTAPSKTNFEPLGHLLASFNREVNAQVEDPQERQANLLNFLQALVRTEANGLLKDVCLKYQVEECLKTQDLSLLADLLQPNWNISSFKTMASTLEQAKLNFACPASLNDLVDDVTLNAAQQKFLAPINGTELGETVRDFIVAPYDRHDIFVKGPRHLTFQERIEQLDNIHVMLAAPLDDVKSKLDDAAETTKLPCEIYEQIGKLLGDYQPHKLKEVFAAVYKVERGDVEKAIRALVSFNLVFIVREPQQVSAAERQRCLSFNHQLLDEAHNSSEFLVSPLTGCGVYLTALNMQLLRDFRQHLTTESSLDSLDLNQLTVNIGQWLPEQERAASPEQQLEFVTKYVSLFKLNNLAIYQSLGLV